MKLNENIASLRKKKGLTQEELAQVFGVTNQAVSKWESAQSCPDVALLPEIAAYFGVSVDALMGMEPSLTRIVSAVKDYVAPEGGAYLPDEKMWEASVAAFAGWFCCFEDPEKPETLLGSLPRMKNAFWGVGPDGGGLLYPPGMFVFTSTEEVPGGRDHDNAQTFCRCFAKEDNWRILQALTWDCPKSAVPKEAVEKLTGMPAAGSVGTVTLALKTDEVAKITAVSSSGRIYLALRPLKPRGDSMYITETDYYTATNSNEPPPPPKSAQPLPPVPVIPAAPPIAGAPSPNLPVIPQHGTNANTFEIIRWGN